MRLEEYDALVEKITQLCLDCTEATLTYDEMLLEATAAVLQTGYYSAEDCVNVAHQIIVACQTAIVMTLARVDEDKKGDSLDLTFPNLSTPILPN